VRRGRLFVISSPSGGGKSTVIRSLLKKIPELGYSVSATTRPPRNGEENGVHYFFMSAEEFQKKVDDDAFMEWKEVHGHRYGTLKKPVEKMLERGQSVLLDIDVQGGLCLKSTQQDTVLVFIMPPSVQVLEKRLRERGTDSGEVIQKRLEAARCEMGSAGQYDFQVINQDLNTCVKEISVIIHQYQNHK